MAALMVYFFFFQAEDGIRDGTVTGVQTCALPISTTQRTVDSTDPRGATRIRIKALQHALAMSPFCSLVALSMRFSWVVVLPGSMRVLSQSWNWLRVLQIGLTS